MIPPWQTWPWYASYLIVSLGLCAFGLHKIKVLYGYWRHRHQRPQPPQHYAEAELPRVTVQLPLFNELDVLEQLVTSVSQLDYPREKLQIQFLDDSTDATAAACAALAADLAQRGFDVDYRHRTDRRGFKAGALDAGMATAKGELLCIFDADFVPDPDYLRRTVDYFSDPKVGIVQARWGHRNKDYSLLTRLQAILLDGHLMLEQTTRSRWGEFCNFNGTAGLWRRSAIDDAGGWSAITLTEDLDLSYRAQMKGWRFVYLNDVIVPAELPPDMDGFKSQQHRWTKGSVQVCRMMLGPVWRSKAPLRKKLEATAHLTANFVNLLTIGSLVLMYPVTFLPTNSWQKALFVDLPVFFLATVTVITFYLTSQGAQTRWGWLRTIPYIPFFMALGIGMSVSNGKAVIEALLGQESEFIRTPKYGMLTKQDAGKKPFHYKAGKTLCQWIELALVGYFGWLTWLAMQRQDWGALPFLSLFFGGFAYVAFGSLLSGRSLRMAS
jgi:cellulose synthase/poly-beta-1,6-N-acetylglucosamine synthase-like glycosyltransferase